MCSHIGLVRFLPSDMQMPIIAAPLTHTHLSDLLFDQHFTTALRARVIVANQVIARSLEIQYY